MYSEQQKQRLDKWDSRYSTPAFAVFTAISTGTYIGTKVYNHDLEPLHIKEGLNTSRYHSSEFGSVAGGLARTSIYAGTSGSVGSLTCLNGHLGHSIIQVNKEGEIRYNSIGNVDAQKFVGTWTNSTRPDLAIFIDGDSLWVGKRSMATTKSSRWGALTTGLPGMSAYANSGSIGFNEATGQLAVLEPSSNGLEFRLATWTNLSPPQSFKTSEEFFQQEGITSESRVETPYFSIPGATPSYEEDKTRAVVVVCDDGTISVSKMFPHINFITFKIEHTDGVYSVPTANTWASNFSTTYGCEQGALYGIRHRVTLDGRYVIAFAPNYYYGAGIRASITRVEDGKVLSFMHNGGNTYGFSPIPINESDFHLFYSTNSDSGKGATHYDLRIEKQFAAMSDGATLLLGGEISKKIDVPYYSTNYSAFIPLMENDIKMFTREGYMA